VPYERSFETGKGASFTMTAAFEVVSALKKGTDFLGSTHSMSPLFRKKMPQSGQRFTDAAAVVLLVLTREIDKGGPNDACCLTFTTSKGVTARAVMIDPTLPAIIRGTIETCFPPSCTEFDLEILLLKLIFPALILKQKYFSLSKHDL